MKDQRTRRVPAGIAGSRLALAVTVALAAGTAGAAPAATAPANGQLTAWPHIASAIRPDRALEARVKQIVGGMTLAQKIGQMTQAEIKSVTPDDVRTYYLGSVLNGGGSWPNGDKHARAADWLALAERYYDASMATDMKVRVPMIWGTDAVHGHNNAYGATIFPHNIALGATRDSQLARDIGAATGKAVRATGIEWVFGPTVAVVRDDRWGRTYESFSEDPQLVKQFSGPYVEGLQGALKADGNVIASIKHYMADGGTEFGINSGVAKVSERDMMNIHAQGYYAGLAAGAQTVMASFNSWNDVAAGKDYGKVHGSRHMLTDILKDKLGFDGFVVTDWNGIGEVPGCRNDGCAQAINAGIDMVMAPNDWKAFIANTIKDVQDGRIPMARIDDAVSRIVRVKLRAGVFDHKPAQGAWAGKDDALLARDLARRAVRESLVLLKNEGPALPLAVGKGAKPRILVVGKAADSVPSQTGGWALTWQGTANTNADFPQADTILAGLKAAGADVTYSADARGADPAKFDAVIAVLGEAPYAEGDGDIVPSGTLRHSSRNPEDLAVLQAVHGKGKSVVTVFLSGRPLWVNDLLNLSDTFIAAWLPGTEGAGVSDLLVAGQGTKPVDFRGKLSFSWPKSVCQTPLNVGDAGYAPLFAYGYGLKRGERSKLGQLDASYPAGGCSASNTFPLYGAADRASFPLQLRSGATVTPLGADLNATAQAPNVTAAIAQIRTQQDARLVTWTGPAGFEAHGSKPLALPANLKGGALRFDTQVEAAPGGKVTIAMACGGGNPCGTPLDATRLFARLAGKGKLSVRIPLACFTAKGADLARIDTPFSVTSSGAFKAAFGTVDIVSAGAASPADTAMPTQDVRCDELQ
jgi:beta-glucosidase